MLAALIQRHDAGGEPRVLTRAAAWTLFAHPWPLNIRELEQCVAAALTLAGPEIGIEHLPRPVRDAAEVRGATAVGERGRLIESIRVTAAISARWRASSRPRGPSCIACWRATKSASRT